MQRTSSSRGEALAKDNHTRLLVSLFGKTSRNRTSVRSGAARDCYDLTMKPFGMHGWGVRA
ncbi:MAG: hypothetical protein WCK86_13930 [Planctomycetia bacterium]